MLNAFATSIFFSCASLKVTNSPIRDLSAIATKQVELNEKEKQTWSHLDILSDSLPGMSVDKTYAEIIKDNKGKKIEHHIEIIKALSLS